MLSGKFFPFSQDAQRKKRVGDDADEEKEASDRKQDFKIVIHEVVPDKDAGHDGDGEDSFNDV